MFKIFISLIVLLSACGRPDVLSNDKGLSANANAKNVALLMSGSTESHIPKNIGLIKEVFSDQAAGYNFRIMEQQRVTDTQAVQFTKQAAAEVDAEGTLAIYFTSHGATDGSVQTFGKMLRFDRLANAIKEVRTTPLKRLVVIMQACYSGQNVNGTAAIGRDQQPFALASVDNSSIGGFITNPFAAYSKNQEVEDAAQLRSFTDQINSTNTRSAFSLAPGQPWFQQLLVMSASRAGEQSKYTPGVASHFTQAISKVFKKERANTQLTMFNFLNMVQKSFGSSTPQFRAIPEAQIMSEPVYQTMGQGTYTPNTNPVPNANPNAVQNIAIMVETTPGGPQLTVSAVTGMTNVSICEGDNKQCAAPTALKQSMPTYGTAANGSRKFFQQIVPLKNGTPYTFFGMDANGQLITQRTVMFKAKGVALAY